jgi:hypothetical protein
LDRDALVALARLPLGDRAFRAKLLSSLGSHLLDGVGHPFGRAFVERWPIVLALGRISLPVTAIRTSTT